MCSLHVHDGISCSALPLPLFWWRGASSPDCPGSAGVTASCQTPGSHQIWACLSAWWPRSQPAGPGWAGSPLSQRDLGFVLASRQTRSWPQLGRHREKNGRHTQTATKPDQWETHKTLSARRVIVHTGAYFMEYVPKKTPFYINKSDANRRVSAFIWPTVCYGASRRHLPEVHCSFVAARLASLWWIAALL